MVRLERHERFQDAREVHNPHGKQSMEEVATATGISKSMISDLETEESGRDVGYKKIAILAQYYGVSVDWLMGLTDDPHPKPTAVDDLGISAEAVEQIKAISTHEHATKMLEALNMILEDPQLFTLLLRVNMVAEAVSNEISRLQSRASEVSKEPLDGLGMLGLLLGDQITGGEIEREIIAAHPELAGRITIDCGQNSLERRIDELGSSFTALIRWATGYHELDILRIEGKK